MNPFSCYYFYDECVHYCALIGPPPLSFPLVVFIPCAKFLLTTSFFSSSFFLLSFRLVQLNWPYPLLPSASANDSAHPPWSCPHGNTTNPRQPHQYSPWGPQDHERVRSNGQQLSGLRQASSHCRRCRVNSIPGVRKDSLEHPLWQDYHCSLLCAVRPLLHSLVAQPLIHQEPTGPCLGIDILLCLLAPVRHLVRVWLSPHAPVVVSGLGAIRISRTGRSNDNGQHLFVLAAILPCLGTSTRCYLSQKPSSGHDLWDLLYISFKCRFGQSSAVETVHDQDLGRTVPALAHVAPNLLACTSEPPAIDVRDCTLFYGRRRTTTTFARELSSWVCLVFTPMRLLCRILCRRPGHWLDALPRTHRPGLRIHPPFPLYLVDLAIGPPWPALHLLDLRGCPRRYVVLNALVHPFFFFFFEGSVGWKTGNVLSDHSFYCQREGEKDPLTLVYHKLALVYVDNTHLSPPPILHLWPFLWSLFRPLFDRFLSWLTWRGIFSV